MLSGGEKEGVKEEKKILGGGRKTSKVEKLLWLGLQTCCSGFLERVSSPSLWKQGALFPPWSSSWFQIFIKQIIYVQQSSCLFLTTLMKK